MANKVGNTLKSALSDNNGQENQNTNQGTEGGGLNSLLSGADKASKGLRNLFSAVTNALKIAIGVLTNPVSLIIILVLLVICIVAGVFMYSIDTGLFKDIGAGSGFGDLYVPADDGEIVITDDLIEEIKKIIEDMGLTVESLGLAGEIDYEKDKDAPENIELQNYYLRKFFEAQLVTSYPKMGNTGVQGVIRIEREGLEGRRELTYVSLVELENLIDGEYSEAKDRFSLDDDGYLCVAEWRKETIDGIAKETFNIKKIAYKQEVQQYGMPMEFLLALCRVTQNPEFVANIAERVKSSEIVITIFDKIDKYTTETTETYKKITTDTITEDETEEDINTSKTTIIENATVQARVTKADIWISYSENIVEPLSKDPEIRVYEYTIPIPVLTSTDPDKEISVKDYRREEKITTEGTEWNLVSTSVESKEDEIISLFDTRFCIPNTGGKKWEDGRYDLVNNYGTYDPTIGTGGVPKFNPGTWKDPGTELKSTTDWLFDLLALGQRTQKHEEIMRYLLGKYMNRDYGVDTIRFDYSDNLLTPRLTSVGMDFNVKIDQPNSAPIIDNVDDLKNAIDNLSIGNQAKNNLKSAAAEFIRIQNEDKVNAVFAMAVTITESGGGVGWAAIDSSTYNWCSVTAGSSWSGSTYQKPR